MAGLVPAIHDFAARRVGTYTVCQADTDILRMMRAGWVYIMSNRPNRTLYVCVTSDLHRRVSAHKGGTGSLFTRRYGLNRLVWCEAHEDILTAIQRETSIKRWPRGWKVRLIHAGNPGWDDLPIHW
jgi:putative endonuclease